MKWMKQLSDTKVRQRLRYFYLIVLLLLWIASIGLDVRVKEGKEYTDFNHVAMYILEYNDVPDNYVPKIQSSQWNNPFKYGPFFNLEGKLPIEETYTEAYINGVEDNFGTERFVFSEDTLYYTPDHYGSFTEITERDVLVGHYFFEIALIVFFSLGIGLVLMMVIFVKEVSANDLRKDIVLDYNLFIEKCKITFAKIKYYHKKWKQKQASKKVEE